MRGNTRPHSSVTGRVECVLAWGYQADGINGDTWQRGHVSRLVKMAGSR